MPRFFFHTADGGVHRDPDGTECSDAAAARREAIRYAGAVLRDEPGVLNDGDFCVEVTDGNGESLFVLCMTEKPPGG